MKTINIENKIVLASIFSLLLILPTFISNAYFQHLVILCFIYSILTATWNILFGFMGVYSFGHQAFFGIGAYISALLAVKLGVTPYIGLVIAGLGAALASLVISWPTFRLKGPYVAIVTLAFAEVLRITCSNWVQLTRGQMGLPVTPLFEGTSRLSYYYLIFVLFLVTMIVFIKIIHSSFGLVAISIRESQDAAESLGINLVKYKRLAFILTSFIAGVTGGFYAHYIGILTPDVLGVQIIFSILIMGLFGGIGTLAGPVLGAFILTFISEYLRGLENYRFLVYSLIIIFTVMFLPGGIAGGFERARRILNRSADIDYKEKNLSYEPNK